MATVDRSGGDAALAGRAHGRPRGRDCARGCSARRHIATSVTSCSVEGLSAHGDRGDEALGDVSLGVRAGEIVGVAGVAGNGQRELAETISGMRASVGGHDPGRRPSATFGRPARGDRRRRRARPRGPARHRPRAQSISISANTVLKSVPLAARLARPVSRAPTHARARGSLIERYDVKTPGPDTPARNLSGGNLQKLVLGREFEGDPKVLVAAQPTRGLDVGAIETVHAYLRQAAAGGWPCCSISEDLDEIARARRPLVVMYEGADRREARREHGDGRGDRLPHGGRAGRRREARAQARAAVVVVRRCSRWARSPSPSRIMAVVLAATGHDPGSTYRRHASTPASRATAR